MRDGGTISSITRVNYRSRCGELLTRVLVIVQSKKLQTVQLIIHENTITMGRRWRITSALHVILDSGGFGCHGHRVWLSLEISRHKKILNCVSCLVFVLFACRGRRENFNVVAMTELNLIWTPRSISIQSAVCQNLAKIARVKLRRILGPLLIIV